MKTFAQLTESLMEAAGDKVQFNVPGWGMSNHTMTKTQDANGFTFAILKKGNEHFVVVAEKGKSIDGGKVGDGIAVTSSAGPRIASNMLKVAIEVSKSESNVVEITKAATDAAKRRFQ